jgi:hypothetical protein
MKHFTILFIFTISLLLACSSDKSQSDQPVSSQPIKQAKPTVKFIDQFVLPPNLTIDSTTVGGLSSLDYAQNQHWYIISDDRAEISPARFYKAHIEYDLDGIDTVLIEAVTLLKDHNGELYKSHSMDPEAIRYNSLSNTLFYASEGGRTEGDKAPFIREMDTLGNVLKTFNIPAIFDFYENRGLRKNGGFESLAFENDSIAWFANELPLFEDSDVPTFGGGIASIRLTKFDIKNDELIAEYAYEIEPIQAETIPRGEFSINSVTELISLNSSELLVLERSYITGVGNYVKIFKININTASDVSEFTSLRKANYRPVQKSLYIDFSDYGKRIDNIEGMAFGKRLKDGTKSLLCVSDNNFNEEQQQSQFWLFSIADD